VKIKSIYINGLHNASNVTYAFGDVVYIFGNNGVGKSTILQAIQFALLGYIPGTAKNSKDAILRHSPHEDIAVRLDLEGVSISRRLSRTVNQTTVDPVGYDISTITKELELPIFNFNEFVGQTANKLKEYFIKNILPTVDGNLNWEKILTESIIDCNFQDRDEVVKYGMSLVSDIEGEVLDQVITANTRFKEEQSFNKAEIQRLQNTIDSLIYYDDYIGVSDPVALNAEILSLNALRDQLIKYDTAIATVQAHRTQIAELNTKLDILGGKEVYDNITKLLPQLYSRREQLNKEIQSKSNDISALRATMNSMETIISSKGTCTYTNEPCKSIIAKIDVLRNDLVTKKAQVVEAEAELENLRIDGATCSDTIRDCESTINQFNSIWERLTALEGSLGGLAPKPDTDKTLPQIEAEIEMLNNSMMKLQANIKYNETIESITKLKFEAELHGEALSKWVKKTDTNGLQTTLMLAPFEELANTMTGYLHQMYRNTDLKAHFNITSKANSFSFGLVRDGIYIPYDMLSSGEKCLYTLALMICIVNNNKSPLKVLLCDDMFDHLDSTTIENTFATLKNISDIQFIFAGVKDCENARDIMITPQ